MKIHSNPPILYYGLKLKIHVKLCFMLTDGEIEKDWKNTSAHKYLGHSEASYDAICKVNSS